MRMTIEWTFPLKLIQVSSLFFGLTPGRTVMNRNRFEAAGIINGSRAAEMGLARGTHSPYVCPLFARYWSDKTLHED